MNRLLSYIQCNSRLSGFILMQLEKNSERHITFFNHLPNSSRYFLKISSETYSIFKVFHRKLHLNGPISPTDLNLKSYIHIRNETDFVKFIYSEKGTKNPKLVVLRSKS